jgi:MinD-like ATPase involved in chromosome partitioning or flagellar assembly/tetratricopeptide (TPR) repeat protein
MTHEPGVIATTAAQPTTIVTFYSYTGGVGRTMAVANVAWVLASAGKRVLVVDWSTESPALHVYLAPFLIDDGLRLATTLADCFAETATGGRGVRVGAAADSDVCPTGRSYGLPGGRGRIDVVGAWGEDAAPLVRPDGGGPAFTDVAARLRVALGASGYDYVLIDSPTGPADANVAGTAWLPDIVVLFFNMARAAIETAAAQARAMRNAMEPGRQVRIIPVPSRVAPALLDKLRSNRDLMAELLSGVLGGGGPVEIPYVPTYAHGDVLAALYDEPRRPDTLLHAYEELTGEITGQRVIAAGPVEAAVRQRYHHLVEGTGRLAETMFIAYAVADRRWADWISHELALAGVRVERIPNLLAAARTRTDVTAILVVASSHLAGSPAEAAAVAWVDAKNDDPDHWRHLDIVSVQVDSTNPAEPFTGLPAADLSGRSHGVARSTLLSYFGLIGGLAGDQGMARTRPRYPGDKPASPLPTNLEAPNSAFVGRQDELELIRDHLCSAPATGPYVLHGVPGVGKSELALEYAHRFKDDYDIQWWIPAVSTETTLASLAELGRRLDIPPTGEPAAAVLRSLTAGEHTRWLLIYDNAENVERLSDLLPHGDSGQVIVTSRTPLRDLADRAELGVFGSPDSVELLRRDVPGISAKDAAQVAATVSYLPLALRMAGAWLRESAAALQDRGSSFLEAESLAWSAAEFARRVVNWLEEESARPETGSYPSAAAACVAVCMDSLREDDLGQVGARLVQLCIFFAPQGVSLRLVNSASMLDRLTRQLDDQRDRLLSDAILLDEVCWIVSRYGLVEVRRGRAQSIGMHRLIQELVLRSMTPGERAERQADALAVLAAHAPPDSEEDAPEHDVTYAELQKHLIPSGALDSADWAVRRWVVNQIRYMYRRPHAQMWRSARGLAEKALAGHQDFASADSLRLRLAVQLANLNRALGEYGKACDLDEAVLHQQRRTLSPLHPRTLMTARSHGGDLRGLGRFEEALAEDQSTLDGFRAIFGDDHGATQMALNNLALSWLLAGDALAAFEFESQVFERRQRILGDRDPGTWRSRCNMGSYLRELGRYEDSRRALEDARNRLRELDANSTDVMRADKSLGVTLRRLGRVPDASRCTDAALRLYLQAHGDRHPDSLSCVLSRAANLYAAGRPQEAAQEAERCLAGYLAVFDKDHPFTHVCRTNLGIYLRADDPSRSLELSLAGLSGLKDRLLGSHPWVLAAAINYATSLLAVGEVGAAGELDQSNCNDCREFLGVDHPCTVAAEANLADSRRRQPGDIGTASRREMDIDIPQT